MLILRNLVGIRTFGTFMPVLIALAFNWTGIVAGFVLFATVISLGLLVRFYMERLAAAGAGPDRGSDRGGAA